MLRESRKSETGPSPSRRLLMTHPSSAFGTFSPCGGEKGNKACAARARTPLTPRRSGERVPKAGEGCHLLGNGTRVISRLRMTRVQCSG